MIIRERAIDAGALGGAAALVLAAWWMAGQINGHPVSTPIARPAPTVTVTAAQRPIASRTTVTAPSRPAASPTSVPAAEPRAVAAGRPPGSSAVAPPRPGAGAGAPSGPSPSPTVQPADCDGSVLALQVLRAACVSVGGSK